MKTEKQKTNKQKTKQNKNKTKQQQQQKQTTKQNKTKQKQKQKKVLCSFSNFFTFPFSIFLLSPLFSFFLYLFFPGRSAEISRSEISGPCPRLLRHWKRHTNSFGTYLTYINTQLTLLTFLPCQFYCYKFIMLGEERRGEERRGEERRGEEEERRGEERRREETRGDERRREETRGEETRREEKDVI